LAFTASPAGVLDVCTPGLLHRVAKRGSSTSLVGPAAKSEARKHNAPCRRKRHSARRAATTSLSFLQGQCSRAATGLTRTSGLIRLGVHGPASSWAEAPTPASPAPLAYCTVASPSLLCKLCRGATVGQRCGKSGETVRQCRGARQLPICGVQWAGRVPDWA
jgi:hypothetical protein